MGGKQIAIKRWYKIKQKQQILISLAKINSGSYLYANV